MSDLTDCAPHIDPEANTGPVKGPVLGTFFRYVIPSVLSLLAISTASVIDGFFVGNYLGADALAAVNVLMPYFSLLFGIALMLAVGGSVKAGIYIGQSEYEKASSIFSLTLLVVLALTIALIPVCLIFSDAIFTAMGASPDIFPLMSDYFDILVFAMVIQLTTLVLYYFVRADDFPDLGMQALLTGAFTNIVLDALFIYVFEWGIGGAAWATLLAQVVQMLVILRYFLLEKSSAEIGTEKSPKRHLSLIKPKSSFAEIRGACFNGFSEFINEISVGLVILVLHWIINRQSGTEGIAAFSVINYLIFISLMVYYGIVDAMHGLLSQNFGAGQRLRISKFMALAGSSIALLSVLLVAVLHLFQAEIIEFFLDDEALSAKALAADFVLLIWPLFLFNGFNVLVCAYLTSAEKALHSSALALSRSLVLPIALAIVITMIYGGNYFIYALPLAEVITFVFAVFCLYYYRPKRLMETVSVRGI